MLDSFREQPGGAIGTAVYHDRDTEGRQRRTGAGPVRNLVSDSRKG